MATNTPALSKSRRLQRWVLGLLVLGAAAWLVAYYWRPSTPVPDPDLTNADPAVRTLIRSARGEVLDSPRSAVAWGRLGMVFDNHFYADEALTCFIQAERLSPEEPGWPYRQAVVLMARDPASGLGKLERAVKLCGNRPDNPRLRLADLYLQLGRHDDARQTLRALLDDQRGHPRANLGMARLEFLTADPVAGAENQARCRSHLAHALAHPMTRKPALTLSAELNQRQGDDKAAARDLAAALELPDGLDWPDTFVAEAAQYLAGEAHQLSRAGALLQHGQTAAAVKLLRETVRDYPQSAQAWRLFGFSQANLKEFPQAEQALQTSLRLDPASPQTLLTLATSRMLQRDYCGAKGWLRKALERAPNLMQAHYNLAFCLKQESDLPGAIAAMRDAVRCQPYNPAAHTELGRWLLESGQPALAAVHLQQALDLRPDHGEAERLLDKARTPQDEGR